MKKFRKNSLKYLHIQKKKYTFAQNLFGKNDLFGCNEQLKYSEHD